MTTCASARPLHVSAAPKVATPNNVTKSRRAGGDKSYVLILVFAVFIVFLTFGVLLRLPAPSEPFPAQGLSRTLRSGRTLAAQVTEEPQDNSRYVDDPNKEWNHNKPIVIDPDFMYNKALSDLIPDNRKLPDARPEGCIDRLASIDLSKLPSTSVVIVTHNEAHSTLRRTVTSVITRSPPELLKEIIVVDDQSDWDQSEGVATMPKVIVMRREKREGLMRARMTGFHKATAPTVTFLDSHVECQPGWLPPLLSRVAVNESIVISPVIDIIKEDTLKYVPAGGGMRGIFDWQLTFRWKTKTGKDPQYAPFQSPTHAGGLFTISKKFFEHLGLYDPGMKVWGYENLELSFRVWMCGGSLEIDPCSRVGHIFRSKSPLKPTGENYQLINKFRTASVWLDDYAKHVIGSSHQDYGDISERVALRKRLKCRSFQWYLDTVFPDHPILAHPTTIGHAGTCFDTMGKAALNSEIGLYPCHAAEGNQLFEIDTQDQTVSKIKVQPTDSNREDQLCVVPHDRLEPGLMLADCSRGDSGWVTRGNDDLMNVYAQQCLEIVDNRLLLAPCRSQSQEVRWNWKCMGAHTSQITKGLKETSSNLCVDIMARNDGEPAGVWACHGAGGNQAFAFRSMPDAWKVTHKEHADRGDAGLIINVEQNRCLQAAKSSTSSSQKVLLRTCSTCDGSAHAADSSCVWWRSGDHLHSDALDCLQLEEPGHDGGDLVTGRCEGDKHGQLWDTSVTTYGLCRADGS